MKACNGKLWGKINDDKIEIRTLSREDVEEALDILDKSFYQNEMVCTACEINLPENAQARQELRELCRLTADDGISLVAKEAASGKIVSVAFNKIQYVPENPNEDPFFVQFRKERTHSPQAQCLMDFMIVVDSETDVFELFKLDSVCELMFLATLPEWERKGIARALAKYTIELTRQLSKGVGLEDINPKLRAKRPQAVTAIFTSEFSQKVGRSQNFRVLNTVPYSRFIYNGKTFDQRINPRHKFSEHVAFVL